MNIREIALVALEKIERMPREFVYAARKGICAGVERGQANHVVFRREGDSIGMELWDNTKNHLTEHSLPADLQERAARMLDNL